MVTHGTDLPLACVVFMAAFPLPPLPTFQTPAISNSFALDGVVTLVDAKNILPRLQEGEEEEKGEEEIDEAFQQIMFSDRIVVNKVRQRVDSDSFFGGKLGCKVVRITCVGRSFFIFGNVLDLQGIFPLDRAVVSGRMPHDVWLCLCVFARFCVCLCAVCLCVFNKPQPR